MRLALIAIAAVMLQISPDLTLKADPAYLRYERSVMPNAQVSGATSACAVLDPPVFAHAALALNDLRLFSAGTELPYVLTTSQTSLQSPEPARILNLGSRAGRIVFDVAMPSRPYSELDLHLTGSDFLATAHVTGLHSAADTHPTSVGTATLYDLSAQRLARSTAVPLQESTFPLLHVELDVHPAAGSHFVATPAMVTGAEVPPSREAQTLYTTVLSTAHFTQRGRETIATFELPAKVPVEHVTFLLPPGATQSFSRTVRVSALTHGKPAASAERVEGEISRVSLKQAGSANGSVEIDEASLSIPATLGANLLDPATVEVAVENGDDRPVPFAGVALEMRQRALCFTPAPQPVTLMYGDPVLPVPSYDLARLFDPNAPAAHATLGPERLNPAYHPRPASARSFPERHPELLWIALLGVVGVLALVALRSGRHMARGAGDRGAGDRGAGDRGAGDRGAP